MSYPTPLPTFSSFSSFTISGDTLQVLDTKKNILELTYFTNSGWQIEVRHDKKNKTFQRQPFTGKQAILQKHSLSVEEEEKALIVQGDTSRLILDKSTFQFSIEENGKKLFNSNPNPFSFHETEVSIYEKIMSLKITDFQDRAPFAPKGTLFKTNMVRFQYPRPQGIVLGLPGTPGEMNRNGYRFELYNTDDYTHIPGKPLYQSWPILMHKAADTDGWVGIFYDNPSRMFVDIGDFYEDRATFEALRGNSRVYIFSGKNPLEVSRKIVALLGTMQLPPLWAFGYQQSRWSYMSTQILRTLLSKMEEEKIPLDAIYYDVDYMDKYKVFTTNDETFGDLGLFLEKTGKKDIHNIFIVDPGIKIDEQYGVYKSLKSLGTFIKKKNGEPVIARAWPGDTILPDFSDDKTITWWANIQKEWLTKYHFDGIWNDMNEPANFEGANVVIAQGMTSRGSIQNDYNLYGLYMSKASKKGWDLYQKEKRVLNISRSGYPGIQQDAIIWHGDNYAWWEHLHLAFHWMLTYSLFGAFYTGADVPGFTGNPPEDLAVRFFQLGSFMPFFRGHSMFFSKDKEPYVFSGKAKQYIKDAILLRYSLLREWYTGFAIAISKNESPFLPVFTEKNEFVSDQILLFNKFLLAPIMQRDQSKKLIYLPLGDWYELGNTKNRLSGNQWISIDVTLETVPVYIKAGSIVTRNIPGMTTKETFKNKEQYEVYLTKEGKAEGYWYSDDGITVKDTDKKWERLSYEHGAIAKKSITEV